tara:strand:- start:2338 stop:2532 length:195 start_codon:yes stop_codon:yes gene_type:complete
MYKHCKRDYPPFLTLRNPIWRGDTGEGAPIGGYIRGVGEYLGHLNNIPLPDVYSTYPNYMGISY